MIPDNFEIASIVPADPPADANGTGWHCYVIEQGENTIRGYRQGDLAAVTLAVEEIVARLNERRYGRRGRVQLDMSARGRKSPAR